MIKQLLKAVMTMALFLSVILGYAETTEGKMFYGLPTYTVGNYMYAVHEFGKSYDILPKYKNSSIYKYTGAILIPNLDKSVKYSGKITIRKESSSMAPSIPYSGLCGFRCIRRTKVKTWR